MKKRSLVAVLCVLCLALTLGATLAEAKGARAQANGGMFGDTLPPIQYIDEAGAAQTCTEYVMIDEESRNLGAGWYVVTGNVLINHSLLTTGETINLILCDGASLTVSDSMGIGQLFDGVNVSLTIYGQQKQSGRLIVHGGIRGIALNKLTVNGGNIFAESRGTGIYNNYCSSSVCKINRGVLIARGEVQAIDNLDAGSLGVVASTNFDGSDVEPYDSGKIGSYKALMIGERAHDLTVKKGGKPASEGTASNHKDKDYYWDGLFELHVCADGLTVSGETAMESVVTEEGVSDLLLDGVKISSRGTELPYYAFMNYSDNSFTLTLRDTEIAGIASSETMTIDLLGSNSACGTESGVKAMNLLLTGTGSLTAEGLGENGITAGYLILEAEGGVSAIGDISGIYSVYGAEIASCSGDVYASGKDNDYGAFTWDFTGVEIADAAGMELLGSIQSGADADALTSPVETERDHFKIDNRTAKTVLFKFACAYQRKLPEPRPGKYTLKLGNNELGEFIFVRNGNGWTIGAENKLFLAVNNGALGYQAEPFSWNWDGKAFYVNELTYIGGFRFGPIVFPGIPVVTKLYPTALGAPLSSDFCASSVWETAPDEAGHKFSDWIPDGTGMHTRTCANCGKTMVKACEYDGTVCKICGGHKPGSAYVTVEVREETRKKPNPLSILFPFLPTETETVYTIFAQPHDTSVLTVEYSLDGGRSWTRGTTFTAKKPASFEIRVRNTSGGTQRFTYANGKVTENKSK